MFEKFSTTPAEFVHETKADTGLEEISTCIFRFNLYFVLVYEVIGM
jgi:hypothetical protein